MLALLQNGILRGKTIASIDEITTQMELTCSLKMAELTSITIRFVMRRSSRPRLPISANVCIGCDLLRQYHFGVVLIFGVSVPLTHSPSLSLTPNRNQSPAARSVNRFLIILCLPGTHSPHVLFPYFLCLVCVIKCKFCKLFNRCQDATPHRLATHACCHMWQLFA